MKIILALILIHFTRSALSQESSHPDTRMNTVKIDFTSSLLYRKAFIISYERLTKPNQSFSFTAGYQQFPQLASLGSGIRATRNNKRNGFKLGSEYRFYLKRENKYAAPRGVYLGPYISFHKFRNDRNLQITSDDGNQTQEAFLKTDISVLNVGFQLGYQFVLNNRWTIDLVFIGPSVSRYSLNMKLDGNFNVDEERLYQTRILQRLIDKFPYLDDLIEDKTVEIDGTIDSWSLGYRYQVSLGYHFGRK